MYFKQFAVFFVLILLTGCGDKKQSSSDLLSACDKGDGKACSELGTAYAYGQNIQQNYGTAMALFEKLAT